MASVELPPYDKNGKGTPTTGINPITMDIFIKTYREKTKVTPIDRYFEKRLFDPIAILNDSKIILK